MLIFKMKHISIMFSINYIFNLVQDLKFYF